MPSADKIAGYPPAASSRAITTVSIAFGLAAKPVAKATIA
jgi:hypothetical protein